MGSFALNLEQATKNSSRGLQPRFRGNANVSIDQELSEEKLLKILTIYSNNDQVQELVAILAGQPWCITAGFHRGGLGGAAGAADPRVHITISTGHHIRFDKSRERLVEITGANITPSPSRAAAQAAAAGPTASEAELQGWMDEHGLTQDQALRAMNKFHNHNTLGQTRAAVAAQVQRNSRK